jgi:hypothetical protein
VKVVNNRVHLDVHVAGNILPAAIAHIGAAQEALISR